MQAQALTNPDSETIASAASRGPLAQPPTILIVEDNARVRDIIMKILRHTGYRVLPAANGHEAIRSLELPEIDLIITDLYMPQMDGMELLMQLRKQALTTPIIVISGAQPDHDADILHTARLLGARMTLAKPFAMQELVTAVTQLIGSPTPAIAP